MRTVQIEGAVAVALAGKIAAAGRQLALTDFVLYAEGQWAIRTGPGRRPVAGPPALDELAGVVRPSTADGTDPGPQT